MNARTTKARLDRLQIAAFQMLFKLRLPEHGVEMAFASALADTGDHLFRSALENNTELVEAWIKEYYNNKKKGRKCRPKP